MIKKIALKYTILIVAVISAVTLIFVPLYTFVQESVFIELEKKAIVSFCEAFSSSVDFANKDKSEDYLEEENEKNYIVSIYNQDKKRILSTKTDKKHNQTKSAENDKPVLNENFGDYFVDSAPVYKDLDKMGKETITLRRIVKNNNKSYYIFIKEKLRNTESIFIYTNNVLIIILICYIIVCGFMLLLLMRGITKSIRSLNVAVKKIADKDYSVRYEGKISKDEVGTLALNFNNMADTIQDNINSIGNYNFLLKEDIDHLKQYEEMKNKFVRNTTHELKTPLAIISSQVEMMTCTDDEEKRLYYYNSAMEEIGKMSKLITGVLKYSCEEKDTINAQSKEINVSNILKEICLKFTGLMQSKKLKFSYDIDEDVVIYIPETHVKHILNNFIMNAVKHTKAGGRIQVTFNVVKNKYRLSVYNDGSPIPKSQLEKIWSEFYSENRKSEDNVGLGLFIVKEIALINHMNCGALNREKGVDFWFDFS